MKELPSNAFSNFELKTTLCVRKVTKFGGNFLQISTNQNPA